MLSAPTSRARGSRLALLAAIAVAASLGGTAVPPAGACACGIALDSSVTKERALLIEGQGREDLVASFDLLADGDGSAAVILPVPGIPEVDAAQGDPLGYLDQATAPAPAVSAGSDDDAAARGPDVDVIGREAVGGYDVTRLRSGDPAALDRWLNENGYRTPRGAAPILAEYVDADWSFVAIRLDPGADGRLKPLRISFDTGKFVYPMRLTSLGTEPVDLTLYILADGPREAEGLDRAFSGPVSGLEPSPSGPVAELLAGAPHLTKLVAEGADPASFTADLEIEPVPGSVEEASAAGDEDGGESFNYGLFMALTAVFGAIAYALNRVRGRRRS